MKSSLLAVGLAAALSIGGCAPHDTAEVERPDSAPTLAASEDLNRLTCADFLSAADIAQTEPADDAALAAQDEIANGLTWLHGYLYATREGEVAVLSQDWMAETAAAIHRNCSAVENPERISLFQVATS